MSKIALIEAEIAKQGRRVADANRIAERTELAATQERERLELLKRELWLTRRRGDNPGVS